MSAISIHWRTNACIRPEFGGVSTISSVINDQLGLQVVILFSLFPEFDHDNDRSLIRIGRHGKIIGTCIAGHPTGH